MRIFLFFEIMALCLAQAAFAAPDQLQDSASKFTQMDKDGSGLVNLEEFSIFYPQMHEAAFRAIDKSGDGGIAAEEWRAFIQGHSMDRAASGMGGAVMPPPSGAGGAARSKVAPPAAPAFEDEKRVRELFNIVPRNDGK